MRIRKKNPFKVFIWLVILTALVVFGGFSYFNSLKSPVDRNGSVKAFVITPGEGTGSIAKRLKDEGLIKNELVFRWELKNSGKEKGIEAGDFKLSPAMPLSEIIQTLTSGPIDKWVTLIEGWRIEEMAKQLSDKGIGNREDFIQKAKKYEGFLFPDSYLFNPEAKVDDVIAILRGTFNKKYDSELQSKIKSKGLTAEQGVILASIVEREGRSDKVRTEVAGILLKRLKLGMKLDADATVQYAKDSQILAAGKTPDKFWKPITQAEYTSIKSPYNTYLNNGLPPTPICNPSLASLNAVANADSNTPYLFYYHDPDGNSHYAKTLEEHNENVAKNR